MEYAAFFPSFGCLTRVFLNFSLYSTHLSLLKDDMTKKTTNCREKQKKFMATIDRQKKKDIPPEDLTNISCKKTYLQIL